MKDYTTHTSMSESNPVRAFRAIAVLMMLFGLLTACTSGQSKDRVDPGSLLGQGFGIERATLYVDNLEDARDYFTDSLGFNIRNKDAFGASAFKGMMNLPISLPDMSSIDLVAENDTVAVAGNDAMLRDFLGKREGVRMYALSSSSVDSTHLWMSSRGFRMDSVRSYWLPNRTSQSSAWSADSSQRFNVGLENRHLSAHLPEFIQSATFPYDNMHEWNTYHTFRRAYSGHPNGVVGLAAIQLVVDDFESAQQAFQRMGLLDLEANQADSVARFRLKRNQELRVTTPSGPEDAPTRFLENQGAGIFALVFDVEDLTATYAYLSKRLPDGALVGDSLSSQLTVLHDYAFGVQLTFQQEPEGQALLAEQFKLNPGSTLDSTARQHAEGMYLKYCALCHGDDREGYAADFAPSLRSQSLLASSKSSNFLRYTIQYGRANTAMAGYYEAQGGPLEYIEIELLLKWLYEEAGVEDNVKISRDPVTGDVARGAEIYAAICASCHGEKGEGISAPALGNPMLLATATDGFLRYAIAEGRDGTPMIAFKDSLSSDEIDAVTAFLRSRASGWDVPKRDSITVPGPEAYVLNPDRPAPAFELRDGLYVSAEQVNQALQDSLRFVLLDARSTVAWRQMHIPGAAPVPYYEEPEAFVDDIPNDSTWIVAYCACPHAASGRVIRKLRNHGFKNTAILDEGILVWAQLGYPVQNGN
ncbi:MAG: c-type cytochrome [Bacteroidota bacterium]